MNPLTERLQILHACWTVNSGTPAGDKYADELAEAMLDDSETLIAALEERDKLRAALGDLLERVDFCESISQCECVDLEEETVACAMCKARAALQPTPEQTKESGQ